MNRADIAAAAEQRRDWVRVDPQRPERILTVPDLVGDPDAMLPGEGATLRVRRDADTATISFGRLRDNGWWFVFRPDAPHRLAATPSNPAGAQQDKHAAHLAALRDKLLNGES